MAARTKKKTAAKKITAARKPARRKAAPDVIALLAEADAYLEKSVSLRGKARESIARARRAAAS